MNVSNRTVEPCGSQCDSCARWPDGVRGRSCGSGLADPVLPIRSCPVAMADQIFRRGW